MNLARTGLNVATVVILFLFVAFFGYLVFVASRAIEQALKRIGEKGHHREERPDDGQQKKQRRFRVACRDEQGDELAKDTREIEVIRTATTTSNI